jgi:hypothetical protein
MAQALARPAGMTDDELAAMLAEHETRSIGYYESEIASQQADAIARYFRRPYGDERDGRSQVVDSTVATTVDNALAAILKPFVSSDETVVFQPRSAEDEEQAEQATEYVNYVLHNDNDGFTVLHDWFKDALLCKLGVVKVYWEDKTRDKVERLERLDSMQVELLMESEKVVDGPFGPDEHGLYVLDIEREYQDGCIKVENVPPEEHRISPLARPNRIPPYEAHIRNMPRSELVEMGIDPEVVDTLAATSQTVMEDARAQERRSDQDWNTTQTTQPGDKSREMVQVNDEYVLVDYDGDGVSELRHIIRSGTVILFNEEVESGPFARLCPVPMPHSVYGMSLADLVIDEQRIATVLWRQTLDNLYLANNPRIIITEQAERSDGSTYDDLSVIAPGAPIRAGNEPVIPFAIPFVADKSYPMLAYVEQQAEARTGIQKQGQGLDPNSLNTSKQITATQSAQMEEAQNNRAELIARIFAETGVKQLFRLMLRLLVEHQPRARMIRLRNKWVEMDPRQWNSDMDLSISVGLGIGNKATQIAVADGIIGTMAMAMQDPRAGSLFGVEEIYNAIKRKFTAAGIKNTNEFLKEPQRDEQGNVVEPETPPSPEAQKMQAEMQLKQADMQAKQMEGQAKLQMQQAENQQKLELAREEAAAKIQLEREKAAAEMAMNQERMAAELELERQRMHLQHEADMRAASVREQLSARDSDRKDRETDSKIKRNRDGGDLSK